MTREEAIDLIKLAKAEIEWEYSIEYQVAFDMAIKALEQDKLYYDFARWVATEIFDEMWEYNKDTFEELACRKLEKLGIVRAKGDEWQLIEPQESEVEDKE